MTLIRNFPKQENRKLTSIGIVFRLNKNFFTFLTVIMFELTVFLVAGLEVGIELRKYSAQLF